MDGCFTEERQMKYLLILLMLRPLALAAQESLTGEPGANGACSAAEYRQFDFWVGEWVVTSNGQPAGTNTIEAIHGGCALQENWQGAGEGGISGSSFNIYDAATGKWHQTWVDASGTLLQLDGGRVGASMVLSGERPAPEGKGTAQHRITWTPNEDGSVRQLWEASSDGGDTWNVLFDGLYVAAGNP